MKHIIIAVTALVFLLPSYGQGQEVKADPEIIAVVLGKKITVAEKDRLNGLIFGAILEKFAKDNKIEATEEEIGAFVKKMEESKKEELAEYESDRDELKKQLKSKSLSDEERKKKESMLEEVESDLKSMLEAPEEAKMINADMLQIAQGFVQPWKVNKALYKKYGGRVIFQQAGVEPLDAYLELLKAQERAGAFKIIDKKYEAGFWRYFTNDAMHTFYTEEEGAKFINTPWWLMEEPAKE